MGQNILQFREASFFQGCFFQKSTVIFAGKHSIIQTSHFERSNAFWKSSHTSSNMNAEVQALQVLGETDTGPFLVFSPRYFVWIIYIFIGWWSMMLCSSHIAGTLFVVFSEQLIMYDVLGQTCPLLNNMIREWARWNSIFATKQSCWFWYVGNVI